MPGIDPTFHCHRLAICEDAYLVSQRKRKMGEERCRAVRQEVSKLTAAKFIKEIDYSTWLSNIVMVEKVEQEGEDVHGLHRLEPSMPKRSIPNPKHRSISQLSSQTQDAEFSICLFWLQSDKNMPRGWREMTFITESANFCYKVMSFKLKNTEATYQHLMDKVFQGQLGSNLEVF